MAFARECPLKAHTDSHSHESGVLALHAQRLLLWWKRQVLSEWNMGHSVTAFHSRQKDKTTLLPLPLEVKDGNVMSENEDEDDCGGE